MTAPQTVRFESPPLCLLLRAVREHHTQGNRVLFPGNHSVFFFFFLLLCVFLLPPSLVTSHVSGRGNVFDSAYVCVCLHSASWTIGPMIKVKCRRLKSQGQSQSCWGSFVLHPLAGGVVVVVFIPLKKIPDSKRIIYFEQPYDLSSVTNEHPFG